MLVDIPCLLDVAKRILQTGQIHRAADFTDRRHMRGLDADFQLHQAWAQGRQQYKLFFRQQIGGNLKMEVGNAIVMVFDILPDCHCVSMATIKGTVYKFYLRHSMIQEKLQFFPHQGKGTETQAFLYGRQAIAAGKGAAAAGLVVDDTVFKCFQAGIAEGKIVHRQGRPWGRTHKAFLFTIEKQAWNLG